MDEEQTIQEAQYSYPYHYIPEWGSNNFSQTQHWSWGFRYLGGLKVVLDQLEDLSFSSLVDIGCGDGRFLREMGERYPEKEVLGVDYSERAINLARAMNPDLVFEKRNIIEEPLAQSFDIATLIEVIEHIPPGQLDEFVEQVRKIIAPGGYLLVTVPHKNKDVKEKHYQHFEVESLKGALRPHFDEVEVEPFDSLSRVVRIMSLFLGGRGDNFVITNQTLNRKLFSFYVSKFLYGVSRSKCGRLFALGKVY